MRIVWPAIIPLALVVVSFILWAGGTLYLNARKRAAELKMMKEGK